MRPVQIVSVFALVVTVAGAACGAAAMRQSDWRADFSGVRGVHPGMTPAQVRRRWHVKFTFSTGSAPGCAIGSFKSQGVLGGALFQGGKFDAVWFERGVRTPGGIRVGSPVSLVRRIYGVRLRHTRNVYDPQRPLYYVRGGGSGTFLEFFPNRNGRIAKIGFGDHFVLIQEGCN